MQRLDRLLQPHDGGAEVAPYGHRNALARGFRKLLDHMRRFLHGVHPLQAREAKLERERPELVVVASLAN